MNSLKNTLDLLTARYNVPSFVDDDPVQFPRRFSSQDDIEIAAFLTSIISWGRRPMILSNAEKLLKLLDNSPAAFVRGGDIEAISEANIHRTFFGRHLRYCLRGLRAVYSKYATMEDFAAHQKITSGKSPAWELAKALNSVFALENRMCPNPLSGPTRCLPDKVDGSALKRLNMMLRWLVRDDGVVDMGVWSLLKPSQLFIPLDVHSGNTARTLGLLTRKQNDRRAVEELTGNLRKFDAADPVKYDFALFGAGVNEG